MKGVIQLDEDWRIITDSYNWILQRRTVVQKTGKDSWESYNRYYTRLQSLFLALLELDLSEQLKGEVSDILTALQTSTDKILKMLEATLFPDPGFTRGGQTQEEADFNSRPEGRDVEW